MTAAARLDVLHQDESLVVVNKPAWWVVHPTRGAREAPVVVGTLEEQLGRRVFPVHRLDRQASGILVLAFSSEIASILGADIRAGAWRKVYQGLCRGVILDSLKVDHPVPVKETRRPAQTQFDPLEVFCDRFTLIRAAPATGRRHQIRYHLKHISHPLVCDSNYGQGVINRFFRARLQLERLFLHAVALRMPHPTLNEALSLSCPLPADLLRVLDRLSEHEGPVP